MEKLDLFKKDKQYYSPTGKAQLIEVPGMRYLSVTGKGDPAGPEFGTKLQSLYPVAYGIKFASKDAGIDFTVPKLEGLWWFDLNKYSGLSLADTPSKIPREEWHYRLMIRVPDHITERDMEKAVSVAVSKKKIAPGAGIELYELKEGKCVQIMHTGPFDREPESLAVISTFMEANHLTHNGLHHEIYCSDFRKITPEKYKTILREPVKEVKSEEKSGPIFNL